PMTGQKVIP
ncbi:hypothetical protein CP03DC29_0357B, partial [Chlamydia psittaci 03DC29]